MVVAILVAILVATLAGCSNASDRPHLVTARFLDETPDRVPHVGETIELIFDSAIRLEDPVRAGLVLSPGGSAGAYTIRPGTEDFVLSVELGAGTVDFTPEGIHGDPGSPTATGISLDLGRIPGLTDGRGRPLRGVTPVVDLEPPSPDPAQLEDAEWVDRDRSLTVSSGDVLLLTYDRPVAPGDELRRRALAVPDDLILLPVTGDRLDDGDVPTRVESPRGAERTIRLVLGSNPHLTAQGIFALAAARFPGSPSGIAIGGTPLRPHRALLDAYSLGVASTHVVDLGGSCDPFTPAAEFPRAGDLSGHTATALPDGRVVVTGGWRLDHDTIPPRRRVSKEVWVYDPAAAGGPTWRGPWQLDIERTWHSATLFPGSDGELGTTDDFILIVGGYNGGKGVRTLEVIVPYGDEPEIFKVESSSHPSARFHHTAHAVPGRDAVVVVGGQSRSSSLNRWVESIEIEARDDGTIGAFTRKLAPLNVARREHASTLIDSEAGWWLLVWGGYGAPVLGDEGDVELAEGVVEVLARPEILSLEETGRGAPTAWELPADPLVGPRRGLSILRLLEEEYPWLLVGGTDQPPLPGFFSEPGERCLRAFRFDIDLSGVDPSDPRGRGPRLRIVPAGSLTNARSGAGAIALEDGRVLVVGGMRGDERSGAADIYDPLGGEYGAFAPVCRDLISPRGDASGGRFTVTPTYDPQLSRRRLLIVGGTASDDPGCELFAPGN